MCVTSRADFFFHSRDFFFSRTALLMTSIILSLPPFFGVISAGVCNREKQLIYFRLSQIFFLVDTIAPPNHKPTIPQTQDHFK